MTTIGRYNLILDERNGYSIKTDKHNYELYELIPVGGRNTTSDILMVMVDDWETDEDSVPTNIGWVYGASDFPNNQDINDTIAEYIENYEKNH